MLGIWPFVARLNSVTIDCLIPLKRHCHQFQISVSPITNNYENRMDVSYFFISVVDLNQNEKKRAIQKSRYHSKMNKFIK